MTAPPAPPLVPPPLHLLDTNILVHLARGQAVGQRIEADYALLKTPYRPLVCIVTHGELFAFAAKRNWGPAKLSGLHHLLTQFVTVDIHDSRVIAAYAQIDSQSQKMGRKMGKNDLWIAAVSHVATASLMTTDADFDHLHNAYLTLIKINSQTGKTI